MRGARFVCVLGLLLVGFGCSSKPAALTFRAESSQNHYRQQFNRGYFRETGDGQFDVVLKQDAITGGAQQPGQPIASTPAAPLTQTVHIRVLWRPLRGSKPDTPSATNSTIDWYVVSNANTRAQQDHLHYRGAGFVSIQGGGEQLKFIVRNARVELSNATGRLRDPLGPSAIEGTFVAQRNPSLVTAMLSDLAAISAAPPAQTTHEGPPPRAPTGP